jgi:hypothetical protein
MVVPTATTILKSEIKGSSPQDNLFKQIHKFTIHCSNLAYSVFVPSTCFSF